MMLGDRSFASPMDFESESSKKIENIFTQKALQMMNEKRERDSKTESSLSPSFKSPSKSSAQSSKPTLPNLTPSPDKPPLFVFSKGDNRKRPMLKKRLRRMAAETSFRDDENCYDSGGEEFEARNLRPSRIQVLFQEYKDFILHFPYLLMGYLQLFFNLSVVGLILYIIAQFIWTVQRDVDIKVDEYLVEIMNEIAVCSKNYVENKCDPAVRVPAMEKSCRIWETCMNRDPAVIGRARVSAETFAEIINSFVEPISYKTMIFFVLCTSAVFVVGNVALSGLVKSKTSSESNSSRDGSSEVGRRRFDLDNSRRQIAQASSAHLPNDTPRTIILPPPNVTNNHHYALPVQRNNESNNNKMELN